MATCKKCGKEIDEGVKFCPSCGTSVSAKPAKTEAQSGGQQADPTDAQENKGMAVVAYILFFIPLITGDHKKSPFVMFHTNQGTVLFIVSVSVSIVLSILGWVLSALLYRLYFGLISIFIFIMPLFSIVFGIMGLALFIIGIINAANGRMKPLPVIGKFTIIK